MKRRFHPARWLVAGAFLALVGLVVHRAVAPRRALAAYRAELQAQGVRLALADCMPSPTPEHARAAQRFLAAAQALPRSTGALRSTLFPPPAMHMVAPGKAMIGWAQPTITDGTTIHEWEDLAALLRQGAPQLAEIREVSQAGCFQWNLPWSQGFNLPLMHLAPTKSAAQWLVADALLALHEGRLDDALEAQLTQLRLVHCLRQEGLLISQLVRIAMAAIAWNGAWELLEAEGWTDAQLARLQEAWENLEFVEGMIGGLEAERALGLYEYGRVRQSPALLAQYQTLWGIGGGLGGAQPDTTSLISRALEWAGEAAGKTRQAARSTFWVTFESYGDEHYYLEKMEGMLREARHRLAAVEAAGGRPVRSPAGNPFVPGLGELDQGAPLLAALMLPSLDRAFEKAFLMQAQREMAVTSIALRRYHLVYRTFPESLQDLVPRFLGRVPCDWLDGAPLRYRREAADGCVLYSVGRDGRDDGGDPEKANPASAGFGPHRARDFVWPKAASAEDIARYVREQGARRR